MAWRVSNPNGALRGRDFLLILAYSLMLGFGRNLGDSSTSGILLRVFISFSAEALFFWALTGIIVRARVLPHPGWRLFASVPTITLLLAFGLLTAVNPKMASPWVLGNGADVWMRLALSVGVGITTGGLVYRLMRTVGAA